MGEVKIKDLSYSFALDIIKLYTAMKEQKEFTLGKQILRCGTSIGANINEASAAQSKADFIHKMSIASKEARETLYWLKLLKDSNLVKVELEELLSDCISIVNILTKIVKTSQEKYCK